MEILAGQHEWVTEVKRGDTKLKLDYSQVLSKDFYPSEGMLYTIY